MLKPDDKTRNKSLDPDETPHATCPECGKDCPTSKQSMVHYDVLIGRCDVHGVFEVKGIDRDDA